MHRLSVVILNYGTPALTVDALRSVVGQLTHDDIAVVVDNASPDDSADKIASVIDQSGWQSRVRLVRARINGGFAAGNNLGLAAAEAEWHLLLNSDTIMRPGAVEALIAFAAEHSDSAVIGLRLEWPDGTPQVSCFRDRTPLREFVRAASTRFVTRLLAEGEVGLPPADEPVACAWVSFAAVLLRDDALGAIGPLDDRYFMYFEDIDYCRRARAAGWRIMYCPAARVVHLRGGSSDVKAASRERRRLPRYYFESRARYFAKHHGRSGLWLANGLWSAGYAIAQAKRVFGASAGHLCRREILDNWTNGMHPLKEPSVGRTSHAAS